MTREDLLFLFREMILADRFCYETEPSKSLPFEESDFPRQFTNDMLLFCYAAMGADSVVSDKEKENANEILKHLGVALPEKAAEHAVEFIREGHFDVPVALIAYTARADIKIQAAPQEEKEKLMEEEMGFLEKVLSLYNDLMRSIPESVNGAEETVITACLSACRMFIESTLGIQ